MQEKRRKTKISKGYRVQSHSGAAPSHPAGLASDQEGTGPGLDQIIMVMVRLTYLEPQQCKAFT